jgi:hypothetical protein
MDQPLALFNGVAYAATHIPFDLTRTEGRDKRGNVVKFDPPKVVEEERLCIIDSAGNLFADATSKGLDSLKFRIVLEEPMQDIQQWSPQGVTDYWKRLTLLMNLLYCTFVKNTRCSMGQIVRQRSYP